MVLMIFTMDELRGMVSALKFAFNKGKTADEFGSFLLLVKLENELKNQEKVHAKANIE
jgi:hypothetical protein